MRDYGSVSPKFWTGGTGKALRGDPAAQLVALYLMTSPHANMIGAYYCPIDYIAKETGLTIEGASEALARLSREDFCTYDPEAEWVFVHHFAAHQIGEALKADDKRVKGVANELAKVSSAPCQAAFRARYSVAYHLSPSPTKAPSKGLNKGASEAPSKPETGTGAGTGAEGSAEPVGSAPASGFAIPLNDGTEWPVPARVLEEWKRSFPAADVEQELREMRAWSFANPSHRKTARGVSAFAVRWLQKAQDTPGRTKPRDQAPVLAGAI